MRRTVPRVFPLAAQEAEREGKERKQPQKNALGGLFGSGVGDVLPRGHEDPMGIHIERDFKKPR